MKTETLMKMEKYLAEKIFVKTTRVTVCYSEDMFKALIKAKDIRVNKQYHNADVTIVKDIVFLSICGDVKLSFRVKRLGKENDRTVIYGDDYTMIVDKAYSEFSEGF